MKRCVRGLAMAVAAVTAMTAFATPAHASAYRYWSYWSWSGGTWKYSTQGPSASVHDGETIGWRFAVQDNSSSAHAPRAAGTSVCSDGVTVVIDYGTTADAPPNETPPYGTPRAFCANDPDSTNGYRATAEHASVRTNDSGLVCGIDGYPKTECAPIVSSTHPPTAKATTTAPHAPSARQQHTHAGVPSTAPVIAQTARPGAAVTTQPGATPAASAQVTVAPTPTPTVLLSEAAPAAAKDSGSGGVPIALIVGIALAAILGGVAVWRYRAGPR